MRKNWIARAAGVAAVALTLSAAGTGTADAAIYDCRISGDRAKCSTVTGIDPGSWLQVRTGPGYGYPNQPGWPRLYNGSQVGLACWTTGDGAYDNPGYRYWMRIDNGINSGYVNDWYLATGGPAQWKPLIREC